MTTPIQVENPVSEWLELDFGMLKHVDYWICENWDSVECELVLIFAFFLAGRELITVVFLSLLKYNDLNIC